MQEFDLQAGSDEGINHVAQAVIPDIVNVGFSLVPRGIGTTLFNSLWLLSVKIGALRFELRSRFGAENAKHGMILNDVKDAAGF